MLIKIVSPAETISGFVLLSRKALIKRTGYKTQDELESLLTVNMNMDSAKGKEGNDSVALLAFLRVRTHQSPNLNL
jgi:hypothetical protein